MKPVVIIAVAVICSVIAVLGVLMAIGEYQIWRFEVALEEVERDRLEEEERQRQMEIQKYENFKNFEQEVKQAKELAREKYRTANLSDYSEIYSDCISTPQKHYQTEHILNVFCKERLVEVLNELSESTQLRYSIEEIIQNKTINPILIEDPDDVQEYNERVDSCRFDKGLSHNLENPATTRCVCNDGEIRVTAWYDLCTIP